jgi:hypothetical protein
MADGSENPQTKDTRHADYVRKFAMSGNPVVTPLPKLIRSPIERIGDFFFNIWLEIVFFDVLHRLRRYHAEVRRQIDEELRAHDADR